LFSSDPEVSISILCFDPDFYDVDPTMISYASTTGATRREIAYEGSVETGFVMTFGTGTATDSLIIDNLLPEGTQQRMEITGIGLLSGDQVELSTVVGDKRVERIRSGVRTSLLYAVTPASTWPQLYPGTNRMIVQSPGARTWSMLYNNKY